MNAQQIIHTTLNNLGQTLHIHGQYKPLMDYEQPGPDGRLDLWVQGIKLPTFTVEIKNELRHYHLPDLLNMAGRNQPFLVVAEKIYPKLKEEMRQQQLNYLETAGNLYIKTGDTFLWIDGNKTPAIQKEKNKAFTKTGLKLVFHFLRYPDAFHQTYRELAQTTGVALGNITGIIQGLNEAGYLLAVNKKTFQMHRKKELLEQWIDAYGATLRPTLFLGAYHFWAKDKLANWKDLTLNTPQTKWGGEAAGNILTGYLYPENLQAYTNEKAMLVNQWTLVPDKAGMLQLYQKFWKDDPNDHPFVTPVLLAYADLILTNDPRCQETAQKIFDEHLQHEFA